MPWEKKSRPFGSTNHHLPLCFSVRKKPVAFSSGPLAQPPNSFHPGRGASPAVGFLLAKAERLAMDFGPAGPFQVLAEGVDGTGGRLDAGHQRVAGHNRWSRGLFDSKRCAVVGHDEDDGLRDVGNTMRCVCGRAGITAWRTGLAGRRFVGLVEGDANRAEFADRGGRSR